MQKPSTEVELVGFNEQASSEQFVMRCRNREICNRFN